MSEDKSARLALPLLAAGQAQKEMTVNEGLALLDFAVQASAVAGGLDMPPGAPAAGQCWIVGNAPEAAWSGCAGMLAGWTADGWRFIAPVEGMTVWIEADNVAWRYVGGTWQAGILSGHQVSIDGVQVVGPRGAAIGDPTGGVAVDTEARAAVAAILATLRSHGLIEA
jgi:hypothetical protein